MHNLSVKPVTQFGVTLENASGSLAKASEALATAGVDIIGFCGMTESVGQVHFVVDQASSAKQVFERLGMTYTEDAALSIVCPKDEPGILAALTRALADASINIEDMYFTSSGEKRDTVIYLQTSKQDSARALQALQGL